MRIKIEMEVDEIANAVADVYGSDIGYDESEITLIEAKDVQEIVDKFVITSLGEMTSDGFESFAGNPNYEFVYPQGRMGEIIEKAKQIAREW